MALPLLLGPAAIVLTTVPAAAECEQSCDNISDPSGGGGTSNEEENSGGGGTPGGTEPPGGGGTPGGGETPGGGGESTPPSKPDEQSQTSSTAEPFVPVFATTVTPRIEDEDASEGDDEDDYSYEQVSTTEVDANGRTVTVVKLVKLKVAIKPSNELTYRQKSMALALRRAGGPSIYLTDPKKAKQLESLLRNSKEISLAGSLASNLLRGSLSDYLDERFDDKDPEEALDELNKALLTLKKMLKVGVSPETFRDVRRGIAAYLEAKGHTIANADEDEDEESEA